MHLLSFLHLPARSLGVIGGRRNISPASGPVHVCKKKVRISIQMYGIYKFLRISSPCLNLEFSLPGRTRNVCAPK